MCRVKCDACDGKGYTTCYNCGGRKKVYVPSSEGGKDVPVDCPRCDGEGTIVCTSCWGKGNIPDRYQQ